MTIPIVPGPFSFLANLGGAAQAYGEGKQKHKKEAWDRLQFMFKGIQEGEISPSVVKSPLFMSLVKDSGMQDFDPESITPAPTSMLRRAQGEEIQSALPGLSTAGKRQLASTGQLPTASAEAKEGADARAQSIRGTVLGQELSPEQQAQVAGVSSATTAQAAAQGAQDPTLLSSAYRVVADLFRQNGGKMPTPEEAFQHGSANDLRAQAFGDQLNQPYYAAAIQQLSDEQEKLKIAHESAAARAQGNLIDVVQKNLTPQMQVLQDRIDARLSDSKAKESQLTPMARYSNPTPRDTQILADIELNRQANARDNADLEAMRRQAQQVMAPRVTQQGGQPEGTLAERRNEYDRRAKAIKDNPNDPRVRGKTVEQLIGPRP